MWLVTQMPVMWLGRQQVHGTTNAESLRVMELPRFPEFLWAKVFRGGGQSETLSKSIECKGERVEKQPGFLTL